MWKERQFSFYSLYFAERFERVKLCKGQNPLVLLTKMVLSSSEELHPKVNKQANICTSYHLNVNEKKFIFTFCLKIINLLLEISGKTSNLFQATACNTAWDSVHVAVQSHDIKPLLCPFAGALLTVPFLSQPLRIC